MSPRKSTFLDTMRHHHFITLFQTNVPEPYRADDTESNLKEGVPEGMSDSINSRRQRWAMEDRIEQQQYQQF